MQNWRSHMLSWRPFRRHEIDILFDLGSNSLSVLLKRGKFPFVDLALQLWPQLQRIPVAIGFGVHHVAVTVSRPGVLTGTTWTRVLFEEPVPAGEKLRIPAAVLPGDRATATLDGRPIFSRRF